MSEGAPAAAQYEHVPVMAAEALAWLIPAVPAPGLRLIDATVGLGGHSAQLLQHLPTDSRLLGLDADPAALAVARERLAPYAPRVSLAQGRHVHLQEIARAHGFGQVQGILFDLGVSSLQLDDPERGFAFQHDGPLDMRMGPEAETTADEIVNTWDALELERIIRDYGEERFARRVARTIVARRPLHTTTELARVVASAVQTRERIHPATRTFQALRIAVNNELASLSTALEQAVTLLCPGGRLVVIAFHSLEDRIVKQYIVHEARDCVCPSGLPQCVCGHKATLANLTRKPLRPSEQEMAANPRSRSARLRVAERLGEGAVGVQA